MTPSRTYWDQAEILPLSKLQKNQLSAINAVLARARKQSTFYKGKIRSTRIDSLSQISNLPLTRKDDLRKASLWDTVVVKREDIAEYHASSGTTERPYIMAMTKRDIKVSNDTLARTWYMHGVRKGHLIQMMVSYGLFTAGLLNQYAIQRIGANIVPAGAVNSEQQISLMKKLVPDFLVAVSSHFLRLISFAESHDYKLPKFRGLIGGGVPVSSQDRTWIQTKLRSPFFNQYGLAEINTGLAGECEYHDGLHIQSDYAYPEIIDPQSEEPLTEGEEGVLVLTALKRDGQLLIRYVTNDITSLNFSPCRCGRTLPRLSPIKGRVDDTIFVKGMKLDTAYLASLLGELSPRNSGTNWRLTISRTHGRDHLKLAINLPAELDAEYVKQFLQEKLSLTIDEVDVQNKTLPEDEHKPKHILDLRKLEALC